ncbi:hypothetical protein SAMN05660464_3228 [Geodermatophilus dictyosporus]|uniref:Integral membrane protein, YkoY family n=1 Tax=Geodermatophilus dictyosporus TaxID=1523247 RepID=A0A1I5QMF7_9ACTN|nr:DUF475 domain-containing protein [Geodermatophilus dictyosporus]SFP47449.1 hypothetical protein SAMN05660464_3228 [Geodermatophilus dictyosporus]
MLRYFGFSVFLTVAALVTAVVFGGPAALLAVAVLGVLEVCLSFDNAVVNAKVLRRMSPLWRKLFLYVGIFIAVFGMRLLLPIVLVAITAQLSIPEVWDLALTDQQAYGENVESAAEAIYTFGGIFLLMIFLNFLFDEEREIHWLTWLERPLAKAGKLPYLGVIIALAVIYVGSQMADDDKYATVLVSGIAGLFTYLLIGGINEMLEAPEMDDEDDVTATGGTASSGAGAGGTATKAVAGAGLAAFLYLEVLDASFSFDGVIGAFAISSDIFIIALGLGIGAFWVRSLTIYMVDKGTLDEYRYLEHGAMWAIGFLAAIMILELRFHISEYVTGLTGLLFIIAAVISSVLATRKERAEVPARTEQERDEVTVGR